MWLGTNNASKLAFKRKTLIETVQAVQELPCYRQTHTDINTDIQSYNHYVIIIQNILRKFSAS